MSGARHFNLARVTTATVGTGTVTLGSAVSGFLTFANAGVVDGATVTYAIKEGSNSEIGRGVYGSAGPTLTRATILESTNSGSAITLAGAAEVFITPSAEDFLSAVNAQTGTTYTILATDLRKLVTLSNGSAIAVTLPQATAATGLFPPGWYCFVRNLGAGTATITPTTSTIDGAATLVMASGGSAIIFSDGTNYQTIRMAVATDAAPGLVELATTAEAEAGTDTVRAVTPAGLLAAISGKASIPIPAVAMYGRTTNGAASGTVEASTNKNMVKSLDFDATTQEFAQFAMCMPKRWDESTITASFVWSHASTTVNFGVVWALEAVAYSDGDDLDTAFGTAQTVADTGGTTNRRYRTAETAAITIAGTPQAEDWVLFQVKRVPSDGSDTMAIDARLEQVILHINVNAFTDN
jgi:hypothetical protein